ncbi:MAG: hypothetical protein ORN52_09460 [Beijerinckiaceae bacterium]|nr:hypothetical protein [Beijerinckiaceae bacterium]
MAQIAHKGQGSSAQKSEIRVLTGDRADRSMVTNGIVDPLSG